MMYRDMKIGKELPKRYRPLPRVNFRRINSLDLIPEDPVHENQEEKSSESKTRSQLNGNNENSHNKFAKYICKSLSNTLLFCPRIFFNIIFVMMRFLFYIPFSIATPSFWLSSLLWLFWKLLRAPMGCIKWLFGEHAQLFDLRRNQGRTVLLSSGSTTQTLYFARNLYLSGARVIVFEFEGLFGLARFSIAVDKFYTVPRPTSNNYENYITAICQIVNKEKPQVYIPICASSPAYFDALAKPHLELLGCASFIPGVNETTILDDCSHFYKMCAAQNLPLPPHILLSSPDELYNLYASGFIGNSRSILMAVGMQGILKPHKYVLPNREQDLHFNHEINEHKQWMVVREHAGYQHYVTCTTVKDSRVIANITCLFERSSKKLFPVQWNSKEKVFKNDEIKIELWLRAFFAKVRFQRSVNAHISFRFIKNQNGEFLPIDVHLGVSHELLNKDQALFAYWDPLPYCAYYHLQLPLKKVKLFLQQQQKFKGHLKRTLLD